jgi:putative hemolysin
VRGRFDALEALKDLMAQKPCGPRTPPPPPPSLLLPLPLSLLHTPIPPPTSSTDAPTASPAAAVCAGRGGRRERGRGAGGWRVRGASSEWGGRERRWRGGVARALSFLVTFKMTRYQVRHVFAFQRLLHQAQYGPGRQPALRSSNEQRPSLPFATSTVATKICHCCNEAVARSRCDEPLQRLVVQKMKNEQRNGLR